MSSARKNLSNLEHLVMDILATLDRYDSDNRDRLCPGCRHGVVLDALAQCFEYVEAHGPAQSGDGDTTNDLN